MLLFLALTSCGKRTPPLPPIERIEQRAVVSGFQQGNTINLFSTLPARNALDGDLLNIDRAEIYRLVEPTDSSLALTEDDFAERSDLIASVALLDEDFAARRLIYRDLLDFAGNEVRLRYAVRFVNASGQRAAFSNFLLIEPTAKIAAPPGLVQAVVRQNEVSLSWIAPETNVDGSSPINLLGYNIYRKTSDASDFKLLNNQPVTKNQFSDNFFEFGTEYSYMVRAVSIGRNGEPVESLDSKPSVVKPIDIFAPFAPTGVTIAAAPNNLSLFFAPGTEGDIAGYRLYRSIDPNLPKSEWRLLTNELLTKNTFQDKTVEPGKTYYYFLTAVDLAGNVSQPSEVVSETAP